MLRQRVTDPAPKSVSSPARGGDPRQPVAWFVEAEYHPDGTVAPVLTVLLRNRECPWRCVFCDLWQHTLETSLSPGDAVAQLEAALRGQADAPLDATTGGAPRTAKLYNAGSFFDARAIPRAEDAGLAALLADAGMERVIVESHPTLIGERCWKFRDHLAQAAARRGRGRVPQLEVAMGLETADPEILRRLEKGFDHATFAAAAAALRHEGVDLRVFVLVQPPFEKPDQAIEGAVRAVRYAFDHGATAVTLIPVRGGVGKMVELEARGEFVRPRLDTLEAAFDGALALRRGRVFADLWDLERFAACPACFPARRDRLQRLNLTQQTVTAVGCAVCARG